MSEIIEPRSLKGFRDFLPEAEIERSLYVDAATRAFRSYGFVPIDTPALEYAEVLLGKGGGETDKQVYRFKDHGDRDVALRFDLTVPLARFIAEHRSELYLPFKRYHIAKVWRGENTQRGRYREFVQCDADIVGVDNTASDFEILLLIGDAIRAIGVNSYSVHFSHRGIFNRFLEKENLTGRSADVLRAVDKISKIGKEEVGKILLEFASQATVDRILEFIAPVADFNSGIERLERLAGGPGEDSQRLREIRACLEECGVASQCVLDPSITRGLDYYTGIVFETFLTELPDIGSICSGGRYNDLASLYTKEKIPGVGMAIGLDRLIAGLDAIGKSKKRGSFSKCLILCLSKDLTGYYQSIAIKARSRGINAEVFPEQKKIAQQFSFAERLGIPYAIICGDDEKSAGKLNLKNLERRESKDGILLDEAISLMESSW